MQALIQQRNQEHASVALLSTTLHKYIAENGSTYFILYLADF